MRTIPKEVLVFLDKLRKNNNREWFNSHKEDFKVIENQMKGFYQEVGRLMKEHDDISEIKAYRIYRDIRFSRKDNTNGRRICHSKKDTDKKWSADEVWYFLRC